MIVLPRSVWTILWIWLGCIAGLHADPQVAYDAANAQFEEKQYLAAVESYETLVKEGYAEPALYYNLGNSYYRAGSPAKALLNFERALLLDPKNIEAWQNLKVAASELNQEAKLPSRVPGWINWSSENTYLLAGCTLFWAGIFVVLFLKTKARLLTIPLLFLALLAFTGFAIHLLLGSDHSEGMVVSKEPVPMRVGPVEESTALANFDPGSLVKLKSVRGDWNYIEAASGQLGWVPAGSVEKRKIW